MPRRPPAPLVRHVRHVACVTLAAALSCAAPARATELSLGGGLGLTIATQPGVRDWIEDERAIVGEALPVSDWRTRLGPAVTPAIELRLRVHPRWTAGASFELFRSEVRNESYAGGSLRGWSSRFEQQFADVAAHVAWWPAIAPGAYVGARAGRGRGTLSLNGGGALGTDPNQRVSLSGTWEASVTTWGVYGGWQAMGTANPRVDLRLGWAGRDLGQPGTGAWGNVNGPASGPLRAADGRALGVDFSGPYAALTFVFARTVAP